MIGVTFAGRGPDGNFDMPPWELIDQLALMAASLFGFVYPAMILRTLCLTLRVIRPAHRSCPPGLVWWCLVPVAGVLFFLWVSRATVISLNRQMQSLSLDPRETRQAVWSGFWALSGIMIYNHAVIGFYIGGLRSEEYALFALIVLSLMAPMIVSSVAYWRALEACRRQLNALLNPSLSSEESDYVD